MHAVCLKGVEKCLEEFNCILFPFPFPDITSICRTVFLKCIEISVQCSAAAMH